MRYLSVCSGIEAASVAWAPLGWEPAAFSDIEPFPNAVLAHHYPDVPNLGDFTKIEASDVGSVDLLIGGTPCQDFSVAGLRAGVGGERGNLTLEFLRLLDRTRPRWVVWENVPGVLSSTSHDAPDEIPPGDDVDPRLTEWTVETEYDADERHAFGCFLAGLSELGYGWAYRVLDAQFFGVPQRRRRVFVVGYFGDSRRAAAVLFERASLSGNPSPRRRKGEAHPAAFAIGAGSDDLAPPLVDAAYEVASTLVNPGQQWNSMQSVSNLIIESEGEPVAVAFYANMGAGAEGIPAVAFNHRQDPSQNKNGGTPALGSDHWGSVAVGTASAVRRLTPRECERLQGFPDDYTAVPYRGKPAADGPRYRALGNSMAVPVIRWLGERIRMVEELSD